MKSINSVEEYIELFAAEVQLTLNKIREIVLTIVPEVVESISYGMPAYKLNKKPLIYFAAFKNHIGLYATPDGHKAFEKELAGYKQGKGSVQFPLNQEMPYSLIEEIIVFKRNQIIQHRRSQSNNQIKHGIKF
jgi:uncharacterized protein YdhG (YjbR/CyaY superfamily)